MSLVNYSSSSSSPSSDEDVQDINEGFDDKQVPLSEACIRKRIFVKYDFQEEQKEPPNPPKKPLIERGDLCSFLPAPKHSSKISNEVEKNVVNRPTGGSASNRQEMTSCLARKEAREVESVSLFSLRKSRKTFLTTPILLCPLASDEKEPLCMTSMPQTTSHETFSTTHDFHEVEPLSDSRITSDSGLTQVGDADR
jgi:hypothetical protein